MRDPNKEAKWIMLAILVAAFALTALFVSLIG